jgi:uncharacterized membrane protein
MDELLWLFLLLAVLACVAAGPILAIVALVRLRSVNRRLRELNELRSDLALLTRRVEQHRAAIAVQPIAPASSASPRQAAVPPAAEPPSVPRPPAEAPTERATTRMPRTPAVVSPTRLPSTEAQEAPKERGPAGPPPVPPAAKPVTTPPPPSAKIDWERWIGIRGAAVLGAIALGLAGLLFFKYSIEHGLITPTMRVVLGTFVGLGCLVSSEWLRRRDQRYVAEAVAGAGVVILYAAFWAAHILYELIPMGAAFVLMILVTGACCAIAWRHSAFTVAVIGLVGGFATPLLLAAGSDRPIGLFGYVLLLDLGLLTLGHKRRWPSLGVLSLLATVLMQALWIGGSMGPDRLFLGLIILGVFAA